MKQLLSFMQSEDRNGSWLEWYEEIIQGESDLDKQYIIDTLSNWHKETNDNKYLTWIEYTVNL